jgi:hypothetical protein
MSNQAYYMNLLQTVRGKLSTVQIGEKETIRLQILEVLELSEEIIQNQARLISAAQLVKPSDRELMLNRYVKRLTKILSVNNINPSNYLNDTF